MRPWQKTSGGAALDTVNEMWRECEQERANQGAGAIRPKGTFIVAPRMRRPETPKHHPHHDEADHEYSAREERPPAVFSGRSKS
jgi:hypothetical protein